MNINFNTKPSIQSPGLENANAAPQQQAKKSEISNLTVTQASTPLADDTFGIEVPEAELMRNDKLGTLISAAFNMPAPPMPSFETK